MLRNFLLLYRVFFSSAAGNLKNEFLIRKFPLLRLLNSGKLEEARRSAEILAQKPENSDLILVDSRQVPPIVRFQSHSEAFKSTQKREEAAVRARLANKIKEMHLTTVTGEHDFGVKMGRVDEWIRRGWRVKMVIEEKSGRRSAAAGRSSLTPSTDPKRDLMTKVVGSLAGTAEISNTPEIERGCLIFNLQPTQKISSLLKQNKNNENDNK